MGRRITGTADVTRGKFYARVTLAPKTRRGFAMSWCHDQSEANVRVATVVDVVQRLRDAHRYEMVEPLAEQAAKAATAKELAGVLTLVEMAIDGTEAVERMASMTFGELAARWTDGRLHREFPDRVRDRDYEASGELPRLRKWILPVVGEVPINYFTLDHAERVLRQEKLPAGSRRHVAQIVQRVLGLAVYPCRIIAASPIPKGWLPKAPKKKAGAFLYPEEDAQLLACTAIPIEDRLLFGVLAREGMRASEAGDLTWSDVDLARGAINLDENKTDDPRTWVLDPGVVAALKWWREQRPADRYVFEAPVRGGKPGERGPRNVRHLAAELRAALLRAGVKREDLFVQNEARQRVRAHDLRATFVTLALACGRTETWVSDRTGHTSSVMINRYRRRARLAAELGLGGLVPLDQALVITSANVRTHGNSDQGSGTIVETTGKQVRREGVEPSSPNGRWNLNPSEEYEEREGARFSVPPTCEVAPLASLDDGADDSRTFARKPRSRVGRAADLAVRAALTGDPKVIGPAMLAFAAVAKRSPLRTRGAS